MTRALNWQLGKHWPDVLFASVEGDLGKYGIHPLQSGGYELRLNGAVIGIFQNIVDAKLRAEEGRQEILKRHADEAARRSPRYSE
jgi:hypothetical protein